MVWPCWFRQLMTGEGHLRRRNEAQAHTPKLAQGLEECRLLYTGGVQSFAMHSRKTDGAEVCGEGLEGDYR